MTELRISATLIALLVLALPASASAALPKTGNTLIVPNKSIGGVALGASPAKVQKSWGKVKACPFQCLYQGTAPKGGTASLGSVLMETKSASVKPVAADARVWSVFIVVGNKKVGDTLKPDFNTPLTRFRTAKGIHLGSTTSQLLHAYHGMKKFTSGPTASYTIVGKGTIGTQFTLNNGKITSITVRSHGGG